MNLREFNALVGQDSYVRCRGKERVDPSIVNVEAAENHIFSGGQVGWWVRTGYIVVDVDEGQEEALKVVKKLGLKTLICKTPKGLHMYFKTDKDFPQKIGMITPFGLKCDFRCANKGYVLLPFGADNRVFNKEQEIVDLPLEFTPIPNRKDSLLGLKDGDGRNATLFAHLMAYKHRGASDDQIQQMAEVVNELIFAQPMDEDELDKIVNNTKKYEAQPQGDNPYLIYGQKGQPTNVNARAVCDYFVNRGDIFVMNGDCYQYRNGVYVEASAYVRNTIKEMIGVDSLINQSRIVETFRLLTDDTRIIKFPTELNADVNLINFKNGVYNIAEKTLMEHDSKYLQTLQIPHDYKKPSCDWEDTKLYKYFKEKCLLDDKNIDMIRKYMAYCVTLSYGLKTFMILLGPSNTGKSVLIRFMQNMVGISNTSALSIHELNMRFYPAQLYNRLLNACADNSSLPLSAIENLKKITGGDQIMHEKKGKEPFFFTPFSKLIFSFNQMPLQLEEKSNAFYKRIRVLNMDTELYLNDEYVNDLCSDESVEEAMPHLLDMLPLIDIPRTKESSKSVEDMRQDSDSIHAFIVKRCRKDENSFMDKKDMYDTYIRFCVDSGREAHKKHSFMRYMRGLGFEETRDPKTREACWKGLRLK
jgi:P4 family phage/plasmid primase-like protien